MQRTACILARTQRQFKPLLNVDHSKLSYRVSRSASGNLPVYLDRSFCGKTVMTFISHVEGDIGSLKRDLQLLVVGQSARIVDRGLSGIAISGDWSDQIRKWLHSLGF